VNLVDLVISALGEEVDPRVALEARVELAERYLAEAKEYLAKGDAVQASEKLYKVVEECIKALAQHYDTPEHREAAREGRWWAQLLGKAARRLARELNEPRITDAWSRAYDVHVWGFHEAKYTVEDVKEDVGYVEWLLNYVKQRVLE
jgi:plasmid stabilization system protein ParE